MATEHQPEVPAVPGVARWRVTGEAIAAAAEAIDAEFRDADGQSKPRWARDLAIAALEAAREQSAATYEPAGEERPRPPLLLPSLRLLTRAARGAAPWLPSFRCGKGNLCARGAGTPPKPPRPSVRFSTRPAVPGERDVPVRGPPSPGRIVTPG